MRLFLILPGLAAGLLSACGGGGETNEAGLANTSVVPGENVAANVAANAADPVSDVQVAPAAVPNRAEPAAPPPAPSNGSAEAPATKRPAVPPPQPKSEPDPHAGHDMANMANMHH